MWQKAKVLRSDEFPETVGAEMWLRAEAPVTRSGLTLKGDKPYEWRGYLTNLIAPDGAIVIAASDKLELLARSDSDFAEDVATVAFEDWYAQALLSLGR